MIVMPQSVDMGVQINQSNNGDKDHNGEHRDGGDGLDDNEFEFQEDGENDTPFDLNTDDMDSAYCTDSFNSLRKSSGLSN